MILLEHIKQDKMEITQLSILLLLWEEEKEPAGVRLARLVLEVVEVAVIELLTAGPPENNI